MQLISINVQLIRAFVFAKAKSSFCHDVAHFDYVTFLMISAIGMKQIENEKPTKPQGFADKPIAVPKAAISLPSVGNDPLDDFMALRMKISSASNKQPAGDTIL